MPETLRGTLVGADAEWDRYRKYERSPLAEGEEQEADLEKLISRRSASTETERTETVAQREERDHRERMQQADAEQREANHYMRLAWYRHLRRVYTNRLDEVEATLSELDPNMTEGAA